MAKGIEWVFLDEGEGLANAPKKVVIEQLLVADKQW